MSFFCIVCKEIFQSADDIYATDCGHAYHFGCLQNWKITTSMCPQCPEFNLTTYKLFLNFIKEKKDWFKKERDAILPFKKAVTIRTASSSGDEDEGAAEDGAVGGAEDEDEGGAELGAVGGAEDEDEGGAELRDVGGAEVGSVGGAESEAEIIAGNEKKSEEAQKFSFDGLVKQIQYLKKVNKEKDKQIALTKSENRRLNDAMMIKMQTNVKLDTQVQSLEQKLKLMTSLLEEEIHKTTKLTFEKNKQNAYIRKRVYEKNETNSESEKSVEAVTEPKQIVDTNKKQEKCVISRPLAMLDARKNEVIIKGLTSVDQRIPRLILVQKLARQMKIILNADDVVNISILDLKKSIKILFRTMEIKKLFLDRRFALHQNIELSHFSVHDAKFDEAHTLRKYSECLKDVGFLSTFINMGQVYAVKKDSPPLRIRDKNHVDELKKAEKPTNDDNLLRYAFSLREFGYTYIYKVDDIVYAQKLDSLPVTIESEGQVDEMKQAEHYDIPFT